jgi:hypothetical protein
VAGVATYAAGAELIRECELRDPIGGIDAAIADALANVRKAQASVDAVCRMVALTKEAHH